MKYAEITKPLKCYYPAMIACALFGFSQNAQADLAEHGCGIMQEMAETIMSNKHSKVDYERQRSHFKPIFAGIKHQFLKDYAESIIDKAYQKNTPASYSDQLDQQFSFGEEIYKECLPKMRNFIAQEENQSKRVINVEGRGVCGLANSCLVKKTTITPQNSTVQASSSGKYATLTTVSGGGIPAGNYGYTIYFDNKVCSGNVYLDGTKSNVQINVYSDSCKQSSVSAY